MSSSETEATDPSRTLPHHQHCVVPVVLLPPVRSPSAMAGRRRLPIEASESLMPLGDHSLPDLDGL